MTLAILAGLRARLARLRDAAARSFAASRQAIARRLAAARAAANAGLDGARDLICTTRSSVGPYLHVAVDRAGRVIHDPDAPAWLARAYVALSMLSAAAALVGLPWPLVAPLALAGGVARLALIVHVLATAAGRLPAPAVAHRTLHRLRAAVAAGLLAPAALSFAIGKAVYPHPLAGPPVPAIVASAPADPAVPLDGGSTRRASRDRRRVTATASFV